MRNLLKDLFYEPDDERYDYKRFQYCDKKFLRYMGINNATEWNALPKKRKEELLREMQY